jgi:hypothetical protein
VKIYQDLEVAETAVLSALITKNPEMTLGKARVYGL